MVAEMLEVGIIQPSKNSFFSPVILALKRDGKGHVCLDYRELNNITIKYKFPILVINELLDELHESIYFTKLDIHRGNHKIGMKIDDILETTFRMHEGRYEFLVTPFGLTNAFSTFHGLINSTFKPFLIKLVLLFF